MLINNFDLNNFFWEKEFILGPQEEWVHNNVHFGVIPVLECGKLESNMCFKIHEKVNVLESKRK